MKWMLNWVQVKITNIFIYITCSYSSPTIGIDIFVRHSSEMCSRLRSTDVILLLGDFNLPDVVWAFIDDLDYFAPLHFLTMYNELFERICDLGLFQANIQVIFSISMGV